MADANKKIEVLEAQVEAANAAIEELSGKLDKALYAIADLGAAAPTQSAAEAKKKPTPQPFKIGTATYTCKYAEFNVPVEINGEPNGEIRKVTCTEVEGDKALAEILLKNFPTLFKLEK
jgi:hypothetical protein